MNLWLLSRPEDLDNTGTQLIKWSLRIVLCQRETQTLWTSRQRQTVPWPLNLYSLPCLDNTINLILDRLFKLFSYQRITAVSRARSSIKSDLSDLDFYTSSLKKFSVDLNIFDSSLYLTDFESISKPSKVTRFSLRYISIETYLLRSYSKINNIMNSVSIFHEKKNRYEDSIEYLKTINFVIDERYSEKVKILFVKRIMLRSQLRDETLRWY